MGKKISTTYENKVFKVSNSDNSEFHKN